MHSDDEYLGFVTWLEVFSDPLMRELAGLAVIVLCLGIVFFARWI